MDLILPLPVTGQYKQKNRGCHTSSAAATGFYRFFSVNSVFSVDSALNLFLELTEAIFQSPYGKVGLFLIDQERR
jgi:hypothetical protein